jgi:hypothetical protein
MVASPFGFTEAFSVAEAVPTLVAALVVTLGVTGTTPPNSNAPMSLTPER